MHQGEGFVIASGVTDDQPTGTPVDNHFFDETNVRRARDQLKLLR